VSPRRDLPRSRPVKPVGWVWAKVKLPWWANSVSSNKRNLHLLVFGTVVQCWSRAPIGEIFLIGVNGKVGPRQP
jgi:hypothetical protein